MLTFERDRNYWFLYLLISVLISIRLIVAPESVADFTSYVDLASGLKQSSGIQPFIIEPLSKYPIYAMSLLMREHEAVTILSYCNTLLFIVGFFALVARKKRSVLGLVVLAAMYVPLMAFVALRAMPAYLLVALVIDRLWDDESPRSSFGLCLLAALFHFSAILVMLPLAVATYYGRSGRGSGTVRVYRDCILLAAIGIGVAFVFPTLFGTLLATIIPPGSIFGKYAAYLAMTNPASLAHLGYFCGVLALTLFFYSSATSSRRRVFVVTSFLLFSLLSLSPVAAYRYSLYFTIPILLNLPVRPLTFSRAYSVILSVLGGAGLFVLGIWQITHSN